MAGRWAGPPAAAAGPRSLAMHLTQLNRECLLHLFSFLDKDSRKSLASTCLRLRAVFEEPALWPLLHFRSLAELRKDNFLLGPALRSLSICWHSSRAQVCGTEDWRRSAFHRTICSGHESLVNDFLLQVCDRYAGSARGRPRATSPGLRCRPQGARAGAWRAPPRARARAASSPALHPCEQRASAAGRLWPAHRVAARALANTRTGRPPTCA